MAIPPPPYANIAGISRADMKDNAQETLAQYNGNARPGELVVDLTTYQLYIGNSNGNLNIVAGGSGNGVPGGANTWVQYNENGLFGASGAFTFDAGSNTLSIPDTVVTGNVIPSTSNTYSLGNSTNQWKDMFVSANTIYINNVPLSGNTSGLTYNSQPVVIASNTAPAQTSNIATTASVVAGNVVISNATPGGGVVFPDGTVQTTAAGGGSSYTDANVSAYLASGNNTAGYSTSGTIVSAGNISTGSSVIANGSVVGGNITTAGTVTAATGNITTVNATTVAATTGNITTVNATTVNTGSATATGNIVGGNLTTAGVVNAASVTATGNVTAAAVVSGNITSPSVTITTTGATQNITLSATGNINVANAVVNNVGAPLQANDAATKAYVDANASGLKVIGSSQLATAAALPAYTYTNGTAGVGATITATANGALTVDGVAAQIGDRVLVKNETAGNAPYNGVYTVTDPGSAGLPFTLTRATDNDQAADIPGAYTLVTGGATQANTGWSQATAAPIVIGTTNIVWSQFSSQTSYSAGNALSLNGTVFNVVPDGITTAVNGSNQIAVKASANLTTPNIGAATFTSLTPTANTSGNVTAGNLLTNNYLWANGTPVDFSSTLINNGNSNVEIATADGNITMAVAGNAVFTLSEATVAIGLNAGQTAQGNAAIAIGAGTAMATQGQFAVAVGAQAGNTTQGDEAVAVGPYAGYNAQGLGAVAIGAYAGNSAQGDSAVAIGTDAGLDTQGIAAVAVGTLAGNQGQLTEAVAVGSQAGQNAQGTQAVAVGVLAGQTNQGNNAVAIGSSAGSGSQGENAIAIGNQAGQSNQAANSIIINATGSAVDSTATGFYVAPVRNDTGNVTNAVYYNTTTKELTYGPLTDAYGNANVATYLASGNIATDIVTTANVSAAYLLGNIANATGKAANAAYADIAAVAYSVDGANVAGEVANAAYANISAVAYSVDLANVAGAGNVAAINLNNSATAYLSGAGTWTTPPGTYGNGNVSTYLASGTNSTGYTTTGNIAAAQGQFTALQAPTPVFNNGALATVLTTTATAFQATVSVQYGNTLGSPTSTQMMQVLATQDATGNASYSVFNRINSNTSVPAAVVTLTAPSAGTLALNVNTAGANAYITCTVTKF